MGLYFHDLFYCSFSLIHHTNFQIVIYFVRKKYWFVYWVHSLDLSFRTLYRYFNAYCNVLHGAMIQIWWWKHLLISSTNSKHFNKRNSWNNYLEIRVFSAFSFASLLAYHLLYKFSTFPPLFTTEIAIPSVGAKNLSFLLVLLLYMYSSQWDIVSIFILLMS